MADKPDKKPDDAKGGKFVRVTASADRRRAGFAFSKGEAREIAIGDLPKGALEALKADPVLVVVEDK